MPTQIPGRADLYELTSPPEHMAYIWWNWERGQEFRELVIDFTIHNDVADFSDRHGLYLMLCYSSISDVRFYFGLQTDVYQPERGGRGKGLIFSRWETRDLANARISDPEEGWTQSSGHEGDFIGVRRSYAWGTGDYRVRIAPDGADSNGEWYGVWITELSTDLTTWAGSLKFPYLNGMTAIQSPGYSTVEIYREPIRPIDIPEWHVSVERPAGDGARPNIGHIGYSPFNAEIMNSEARYDPTGDAVHFYVGGVTERMSPVQNVEFK